MDDTRLLGDPLVPRFADQGSVVVLRRQFDSLNRHRIMEEQHLGLAFRHDPIQSAYGGQGIAVIDAFTRQNLFIKILLQISSVKRQDTDAGVATAIAREQN